MDGYASLNNNKRSCLNWTTNQRIKVIDTIRLRIYKDVVRVENNADVIIESPLQLRGNTEIFNYVLFRTKDDIPIFGKKAYINCDFVKVTFRDSGTFVHFSLPKSKYLEHNAYPVSLSDVHSIIENHENTLCKNGVYLSLRDSFLSRVDLFRDIITSHNFESYFPLFEKIHGKRMSRRRYRTTYNYSNSVVELEFYDKYQQMLDATNTLVPESFHKNTMRVELRLLQGNKCKNILGVNTLNELLVKWNELPSIFSSTVNDMIFSRFDGCDINNITCRDDSEMLNQFYTKYKNQPFNRYIKQLGRIELLKRWPDLRYLRKEMLNHQDKTAVSKSISLVKAALSNPIYSSDSEIPLNDLLNELKDKILR